MQFEAQGASQMKTTRDWFGRIWRTLLQDLERLLKMIPIPESFIQWRLSSNSFRSTWQPKQFEQCDSAESVLTFRSRIIGQIAKGSDWRSRGLLLCTLICLLTSFFGQRFKDLLTRAECFRSVPSSLTAERTDICVECQHPTHTLHALLTLPTTTGKGFGADLGNADPKPCHKDTWTHGCCGRLQFVNITQVVRVHAERIWKAWCCMVWQESTRNAGVCLGWAALPMTRMSRSCHQNTLGVERISEKKCQSPKLLWIALCLALPRGSMESMIWLKVLAPASLRVLPCPRFAKPLPTVYLDFNPHQHHIKLSSSQRILQLPPPWCTIIQYFIFICFIRSSQLLAYLSFLSCLTVECSSLPNQDLQNLVGSSDILAGFVRKKPLCFMPSFVAPFSFSQLDLTTTHSLSLACWRGDGERRRFSCSCRRRTRSSPISIVGASAHMSHMSIICRKSDWIPLQK